ncbi:MAG: sialidase family protein [Bacteroidales bacterium]
MKSILTILYLFCAATLIAQNPYKGEKCIIKSEFIYRSADVKFPSCHASTIIQTSDGLLAAWFGGTAERNPDVGIWISRFTDGKWSGPEEAANGIRNDKRYPCWNPVLFNAGDEILLFYKVGPSPSTWWGELITSEDKGVSWYPSRKLPDGIIGPVKNKPVLLSTGMLLCPSSTENDGWRVHMEMTPDNGFTWERTPPLNEKNIGAIQPAILLHPERKLQILCRSRQSKILTSWSEDNGKKWTSLTPLNVPNPNSGIDAVTLKDGRHLLVYNHLTSGRNILNVAVSEDGNVWKAAVLLENDKKETEYSYPAIIQSSDNLIHITYTWNRKLIKHVVLNPDLLEPKPFANSEWPSE